MHTSKPWHNGVRRSGKTPMIRKEHVRKEKDRDGDGLCPVIAGLIDAIFSDHPTTVHRFRMVASERALTLPLLPSFERTPAYFPSPEHFGKSKVRYCFRFDHIVSRHPRSRHVARIAAMRLFEYASCYLRPKNCVQEPIQVASMLRHSGTPKTIGHLF